MLTHITLIVALCSGVSMQQIQTQLDKLETQNPGSKVTLKLDKKATCDSSGKILEKSRSKKSVTAKN